MTMTAPHYKYIIVLTDNGSYHILFVCKALYYVCKVLLWSWSYGSWIYNYLCNRCLSPLMLWVRLPLRARSTILC